MRSVEGVDRRRFTRIPIEANVRLVNARGKWTCELIDISLRGILASLPDAWQANIGDPFLIELRIKNDNSKIHMNGTLVRVDSDKVAFKAQHMGESSIFNLTKIVKNNIGDTEILDRELTALFGC